MMLVVPQDQGPRAVPQRGSGVTRLSPLMTLCPCVPTLPAAPALCLHADPADCGHPHLAALHWAWPLTASQLPLLALGAFTVRGGGGGKPGLGATLQPAACLWDHHFKQPWSPASLGGPWYTCSLLAYFLSHSLTLSRGQPSGPAAPTGRAGGHQGPWCPPWADLTSERGRLWGHWAVGSAPRFASHCCCCG